MSQTTECKVCGDQVSKYDDSHECDLTIEQQRAEFEAWAKANPNRYPNFNADLTFETARNMYTSHWEQADFESWQAAIASVSAQQTQANISEAVNRFLGWKLPDDFYPDCYVNFDREKAKKPHSWPIGTNLFTASQAKAMFEHCFASVSKPVELTDEEIKQIAQRNLTNLFFSLPPDTKVTDFVIFTMDYTRAVLAAQRTKEGRV